MNDEDLALLKLSTDKIVEIKTIAGEQLIVKVLWVFENESEADLFYELISTSDPVLYPREDGGSIGYSLPLDSILSVEIHEKERE